MIPDNSINLQTLIRVPRDCRDSFAYDSIFAVVIAFRPKKASRTRQSGHGLYCSNVLKVYDTVAFLLGARSSCFEIVLHDCQESQALKGEYYLCTYYIHE